MRCGTDEPPIPNAAGFDSAPLGFGNPVLIRAADGRVSWLLHMEPGSVVVKTGDRLVTGQMLGRIGFSGDSLFSRLHFNVTPPQKRLGETWTKASNGHRPAFCILFVNTHQWHLTTP